MGTFAFVLQILLLLSGLFLMLIILLQRGRGGGLAGAFGGTGGQSAFGTKAGDVFTWITIVTATVWVLLAGIGGCAMRMNATSIERSFGSAADDEDEGASMSAGDSESEDSSSTESSNATTEGSTEAEDSSSTEENSSTETDSESSETDENSSTEPESTDN